MREKEKEGGKREGRGREGVEGGRGGRGGRGEDMGTLPRCCPTADCTLLREERLQVAREVVRDEAAVGVCLCARVCVYRAHGFTNLQLGSDAPSRRIMPPCGDGTRPAADHVHGDSTEKKPGISCPGPTCSVSIGSG